MSLKQSEKKLPIEHPPKEMLIIILKRLGLFLAVVLGTIVLFALLLLMTEYPVPSLLLMICLALLVFLANIYLKLNKTQQHTHLIQEQLEEINDNLTAVFHQIKQISETSHQPPDQAISKKNTAL